MITTISNNIDSILDIMYVARKYIIRLGLWNLDIKIGCFVIVIHR